MRIGILGLQGCYEPHRKHLTDLGVEVRRIVYPSDLDGLAGVVLPGGESTTMLKTASPGLWSAVSAFAETGAVWGICAGCILLAKKVTHPEQFSLGVIDVDVVRNAYGAQNESFIAPLSAHLGVGGPATLVDCVFIRAPQISRVGDGLHVPITHNGAPVMVENERHMVTTFHPELTPSALLHRHFLAKAEACQV